MSNGRHQPNNWKATKNNGTFIEAVNTVTGELFSGTVEDFNTLFSNVRQKEMHGCPIIAGQDPTQYVNPTKNGELFINKISGEVFVCIDNSLNDNSWRSLSGNPPSFEMVSCQSYIGEDFSAHPSGSDVFVGDTNLADCYKYDPFGNSFSDAIILSPIISFITSMQQYDSTTMEPKAWLCDDNVGGYAGHFLDYSLCKVLSFAAVDIQTESVNEGSDCRLSLPGHGIDPLVLSTFNSVLAGPSELESGVSSSRKSLTCNVVDEDHIDIIGQSVAIWDGNVAAGRNKLISRGVVFRSGGGINWTGNKVLLYNSININHPEILKFVYSDD